MFMQHYGLGHDQFIWELRQNTNIVDVFAALWGIAARDLLVSFDAARLLMTCTQTSSSHAMTLNAFIQSWATANHVDTGDTTLALLEGSHLYHADFAAQFGISDRENWFNIKGNKVYVQFYLERG
jgi:hypothetical protein